MLLGRGTKATAAGMAARGAGKAARGAAKGGGKAALGTGKTLLGGGGRGGVARKAARGAGKVALKGGVRALTPKEPATTRYLKYGLFAVFGFTVGALIARSSKEREVSSSFTDAASVGASDPARPQRPEDPNRTGAEREYSDPSAGPLIGRSHPSEPPPDIPVQHEEVENRIRTRIGEDPRTLHLAHVNVEVNDDVADIRGEVHSEEEKQAVGEIAGQIEGVNEVRNLLTVNPQAPTRGPKAAGSDLGSDAGGDIGGGASSER